MLTIIDIIEIKPEYQTGKEPGIVLVCRNNSSEQLLPGALIKLSAKAGETLKELVVKEVKDHGDSAISLYFPGVMKSDIPKAYEKISWANKRA